MRIFQLFLWVVLLFVGWIFYSTFFAITNVSHSADYFKMEFANAQFFRKVEGGGMTIGAGGLPSCGFMAGGIRFESNRPPVLKYKMKPLSRFQSAEFIDSARERFPSDSAILKDAANVTTTGYTAEQNADGYCDRYVLISNESKHTYFFAINRFSP